MSIVAATYGGSSGPRWSRWTDDKPIAPADGFLWIDVVDPDEKEIGNLQRAFGLHELAVEDSMSDGPPAKVDLYPDHVFIIAKAPSLSRDVIKYTDCSIFLSERLVITVRRTRTELENELRKSSQKIAARGITSAEYVVHEVLDRIVDDYLPVIQKIADQILQMERRLLRDSLGRAEIERIFRLRRETIHFQYVLSRMFEVCNKLATIKFACISDASRPYFRNVLDHVAHIDAMSTGLIDVIHSALEASSLVEQQRQSAITRQLAAWGAIISVPTAIAGIYRLNFNGAQSSWSLWLIIAVMALLCVALYWRFRSLSWLGASTMDEDAQRRPRSSYTQAADMVDDHDLECFGRAEVTAL